MQKAITTNSFTPVRSLRLSEEIIRQIARLIEDGSLQLNDRFPSERELEERWQVSRPVLREAFRVLEMQGVVESRPGAGRYLRADHIPDPALAQRRRLQENREHLLQVWDAREAVEAKAAELAATRATPDELAAMRRTFETLNGASVEDLRRFDFNREFHMSIAKASGNLLIEEIVAALLSRSNQIGYKEALENQDWLKLQGRHQLIYDTIIGRDPAGAREAIINHFNIMRRSIGAL